jgi:NADP-dependent aldehyde dehydrogenase
MTYSGLAHGYARALDHARARGVEVVASAAPTVASEHIAHAQPTLLCADIGRFLDDPTLREEIFGPVSVFVTANDVDDLVRAAETMDGQLTATIHGTAEELREHSRLVEILQRKVGRLIFNAYPTGVEVGHAMQHGGPYPASTDSRTTSVGSAAIERFVRPVCYQGFPDAALPPALRDRNELGIWRLVNGALTRTDLATP